MSLEFGYALAVDFSWLMPSADAPFIKVLLWAIAMCVVIVGPLMLIEAAVDSILESKKRSAANAAAALRREQQRVADQEAIRQREEEAALAASQAGLEARESEIARCRTEMSQATLEELDARLKQGMMMFNRMGEVISVQVVGVPTGYVAVHWVLDESLPYPLRVVGVRDKKIVFSEHAYRGQFVDLYRRGKEHCFRIHAYDGDDDQEPDLKFMIHVPTPKQFARQVKPVDVPPPPPIDEAALRKDRIAKQIESLTAEDALWLNARAREYERIDALPISDIEKRKMKAASDARLQQERDKEDQDR